MTAVFKEGGITPERRDGFMIFRKSETVQFKKCFIKPGRRIKAAGGFQILYNAIQVFIVRIKVFWTRAQRKFNT